ncbi:MAG: hypothetical protein LBR35_00500, partial [Rickettsiales bacterium]|nr:hypothetical protein [Rickettsiales bacterium]
NVWLDPNKNDCIDVSDCEYTQEYSWVGEVNGYASCIYVGQDEVWCKKVGENVNRIVLWNDGWDFDNAELALCEDTGELSQFDIPYVGVAENSLSCLNYCRPSLKAKDKVDEVDNNTVEDCCNPTNPEDVSITNCQKLDILGDTKPIKQWIDNTGWTERSAICDVDAGYDLDTSTWMNFPATLNDDNLTTHCPAGTVVGEGGNCEFCKAVVCTGDDSIDNVTGNCSGTNYSAFGVQYNSGLCWKCGTPQPPLCPNGSVSMSEPYLELDETVGNRYWIECSGGWYSSSSTNGAGCFPYVVDTSSYPSGANAVPTVQSVIAGRYFICPS